MCILCYLKAFCSHQWAAGSVGGVAMSVITSLIIFNVLKGQLSLWGRNSHIKKSVWWHGNNGKVLQDIKDSRWRSFAKILTVDPGLPDLQ